MTANFLDYTYLKYSFSIFPFIIYDDIYQHHSVYSCFIYRQSLRKENIVGLIFVSWYPTVYWIINAAVVIFAFPKALKERKVAMLHGQAQTEEISNGKIVFEFS